jgi:hypothetical protein
VHAFVTVAQTFQGDINALKELRDAPKRKRRASVSQEDNPIATRISH